MKAGSPGMEAVPLGKKVVSLGMEAFPLGKRVIQEERW
jgi:hypothetical protein